MNEAKKFINELSKTLPYGFTNKEREALTVKLHKAILEEMEPWTKLVSRFIRDYKSIELRLRSLKSHPPKTHPQCIQAVHEIVIDYLTKYRSNPLTIIRMDYSGMIPILETFLRMENALNEIHNPQRDIPDDEGVHKQELQPLEETEGDPD